LTSAQLHVKTR